MDYVGIKNSCHTNLCVKLLKTSLSDVLVYVKGHEKKLWLEKFLGIDTKILVIDLAEIGCPVITDFSNRSVLD